MRTNNINRVSVFICCVFFILSACLGTPDSQNDSLYLSDETAIASSSIAPDTPLTPELPAKAVNLREALALSSGIITESLDSGTRIAIVSIAAPDLFEGEYALEELTMLLVNAKKFRVVERRDLDAVLTEQRFQLSGEVDDDTAVFIGHLTGAAFVISGGISPWEQAKHLRLKVLDVETGEIRVMTSIPYGGNV